MSIDAVAKIQNNEIQNAFCLTGYRSHDSEHNQKNFNKQESYNNIALAANYLTRNKNLKRVAIIDWDLDHSLSTETLFYKRKDVMYISLHN